MLQLITITDQDKKVLSYLSSSSSYVESKTRRFALFYNLTSQSLTFYSRDLATYFETNRGGGITQ